MILYIAIERGRNLNFEKKIQNKVKFVMLKKQKSEKWSDFSLRSFKLFPPEQQLFAIQAIKLSCPQEIREELVVMIKKNPETWWVKQHHGLGRDIRNYLRKYCCLDENLPDEKGNWDDFYVGVVEVAVKEGIYHKLTEKEQKYLHGGKENENV